MIYPVVVVVNSMKPFTHASPRYGELRRGSCKWLFLFLHQLAGNAVRQWLPVKYPVTRASTQQGWWAKNRASAVGLTSRSLFNVMRWHGSEGNLHDSEPYF